MQHEIITDEILIDLTTVLYNVRSVACRLDSTKNLELLEDSEAILQTLIKQRRQSLLKEDNNHG